MDLEYPSDLKYLDSHEYVRLEGEIAQLASVLLQLIS
jgi:glycine cleavage system H protein